MSRAIDNDTVEDRTVQTSTNRAQFLSRGAKGGLLLTVGGGVLLAAACGDDDEDAAATTASSTAGEPVDDVAIAKLAATAELLAVDFYGMGIASGLFAKDVLAYMTASLKNEQDHYDALAKVLGMEAPKDLTFTYPAGTFDSAASIAKTGAALEEAFVGAYMGAVTALKDNGLKKVAAQIGANEAQHLTALNSLAAGGRLVPNPSLPKVLTAAEATATANAGGSTPTLDKDTVRIALANTNRTEPAVPFAQAKGFLTMPSSGVTVIDYGAGDGFGGISRGLSVVTRADAQVVSPADGWVMFQGDYLNYGQIVILNAGQDYTILLAGLAKVDVQIGQFVMMGEPVGTMGSQTIGRTVATSAGVSRPTLYIEMRKNNEPVDPTGWWSVASVPTQSG